MQDSNETLGRPSAGIAFLYGPLTHGGTATLILRVANYLAAEGRPVAVMVNPGGDLEPLLSPGVQVVHYFDSCDIIEKANVALRLGSSSNGWIIISLDTTTAARGQIIAGNIPSVYHVNGIFHPQEYFMPGQPLDRRVLNCLLARSIGSRAMFYMNRESRETHAAQFGGWVNKSALITLPVGTPSLRWKPIAHGPTRIVSIGRLVDFKAYNNAAPSIVRALQDDGIPVVWDIYGTGPEFERIETAIADQQVADSVKLHGQAPYERFEEIVVSHDLFVGMGTAAVEAALVGVPTIVATIDEQNSSHGFFDDIPPGNVGERVESLPARRIDRLIRQYCSLSREEKSRLSARQISASEPYSIGSFIAAIDSHFPLEGKSSLGITRLLWARFFVSLMDGRLSRALYGRGFVTGLKGIAEYLKRKPPVADFDHNKNKKS